MSKFKYMILGVMAAVTVPIIASTNLGRMSLSWPDLDDPGGPAMVAEVQGTIESLSDNMPSRINEFSAIADSVTTTITHNFGLNSADLGLILYTGVGNTKVFNPIGASGFTIIDNVGDPKNQIDITTPSSGGPHDFSFLVSWGGGSTAGSNDNLTFSLPLFEDIPANTMVRAIDDGGTSKFAKVVSLSGSAHTLTGRDSTASTRFYFHSSKKAFSSADNYYLTIQRETSNSDIALTLFSYDGSSIVVEDDQLVPDSIGTTTVRCVSYDPVADLFVIGYRRRSDDFFSLRTVSVTGGTISFNAEVGIILSTNSDCALSYDVVEDKHLLIYKPTSFSDTNAAVVTITGSVPSIGTPVLIDSSAKTRHFSVYITDKAQHIATHIDSGITARKITISGTTPTVVNTVNTSASYTRMRQPIYDQTSGSVIIPITNTKSLVPILTSGGVPTFGAAVTLGGSITLGTDGYLELGKNESNGEMFAAFHEVPAGTETHLQSFTVAANAITLGSVATEAGITDDFENLGGMFYYPNHLELIPVFNDSSATKEWVSFNIVNNFVYHLSEGVGILGAGGTTGQTVEATLLGGTSDSFVGQTISGPAYIQLDASVSSTATQINGVLYKVGSFVSPTELFLGGSEPNYNPAATSSASGTSSEENIIANPNAEAPSNTDGWTNTGSGVFNVTSTLGQVAFGLQSFSWDSGAAAETITSVIANIPLGLDNILCTAEMYYKGGDANLTFRVIQNSVVLKSQLLSAQTDFVRVSLEFPCEGNVNGQVEIVSSADAAVIYFDKVHYGTKKIGNAPFIGGTVEYLPTTAEFTNGTGLGVDSTSYINFARTGDKLEIEFSLEFTGGVGSDAGNFNYNLQTAVTNALGSGVTLDFGAGTFFSSIGYYILGTGGIGGIVYHAAAGELVFYEDNDAGSSLNGNHLGTNAGKVSDIAFSVTVQIIEWDGAGIINLINDDVSKSTYELKLDGSAGTIQTSFTVWPAATATGNGSPDYNLSTEVWTAPFDGRVSVSWNVGTGSGTGDIDLAISRNDVSLASSSFIIEDLGGLRTKLHNSMFDVSVGDEIRFAVKNAIAAQSYLSTGEVNTLYLTRTQKFSAGDVVGFGLATTDAAGLVKKNEVVEYSEQTTHTVSATGRLLKSNIPGGIYIVTVGMYYSRSPDAGSAYINPQLNGANLIPDGLNPWRCGATATSSVTGEVSSEYGTSCTRTIDFPVGNNSFEIDVSLVGANALITGPYYSLERLNNSEKITTEWD